MKAGAYDRCAVRAAGQVILGQNSRQLYVVLHLPRDARTAALPIPMTKLCVALGKEVSLFFQSNDGVRTVWRFLEAYILG